MLQNTFFFIHSPVILKIRHAEKVHCDGKHLPSFSLSLAARYDPAAAVSSSKHLFPTEISIDLHRSFVCDESNELSAHCLVPPYGTGPANKEDCLGLRPEQERR